MQGYDTWKTQYPGHYDFEDTTRYCTCCDAVLPENSNDCDQCVIIGQVSINTTAPERHAAWFNTTLYGDLTFEPPPWEKNKTPRSLTIGIETFNLQTGDTDGRTADYIEDTLL